VSFEDNHGEKGSTILRRLDPRIKLLGVVTFSVVVATAQDISPLVFAVVLASIATIMSGISVRTLLGRVAAANCFVALFWVFLPLTIAGNSLFSIGPFEVSREGLWYAGMLTLRSNAIILAMIAFMAVTPVTSTVHALTRLKVPDELVCLFFFTYRYSHEIVKEYTRLHNSMKIRCFVPRSNIHTYRSYAYLVGVLLANSYERGQRLQAAMLCRGFTGKIPHLDTLRIGYGDIGAATVITFILTGMVMLNGG